MPKFAAALDAGADLVVGILQACPAILGAVVSDRGADSLQHPGSAMRDEGLLDGALPRIGLVRFLSFDRHRADAARGAPPRACRPVFVPTRERVGHARIGTVFRANFVIMRALLIGLSRQFCIAISS